MVAGDDLAAEVCARALAAAGAGCLRLVRRAPMPEAVVEAMRASNPDVRVEMIAWPQGAGDAWLAALAAATAIVRSGFDDDAMVRAAVRLGVPATIMRGSADAADVISFRKHGPCPHLALDLPEHAAAVGPADAASAVVVAQVAAAEALVVVAGATEGAARARHVRVQLGAAGSDSPTTRATDIPWTPECFACGGSATEMSFS